MNKKIRFLKSIFIFSKIYGFVDNIQEVKKMSLEALSILESIRFRKEKEKWFFETLISRSTVYKPRL